MKNMSLLIKKKIYIDIRSIHYTCSCEKTVCKIPRDFFCLTILKFEVNFRNCFKFNEEICAIWSVITLIEDFCHCKGTKRN